MSLTLPLLAVADPSDGSFDFTQTVAGNETIYARLNLKASEVVAWLGALKHSEREGDEPLILLADTFILDHVNFGTARAIKIVTRVFETPGTPLTLSIPVLEPKQPFIFEVVAEETRGSVFSINFTGGNRVNVESFYRSDRDVNGSATYIKCLYGNLADASGKKEYRSKGICEPLGIRATEGARAPGSWNRLRALFPLACDQIATSAERAVGLSRLRWIGRLAGTLASEEGPYQIEASHLTMQAGAMLALTHEEGRPRPVPILSEASLNGRIKSQLAILGHYEAEIRGLETREDSQLTAESFAEAWRKSVDDNEAVLALSAQRADEEYEAQLTQYYNLRWAFEVQNEALHSTFIIFQGGLERSAILKTTAAILELVAATASLAKVYYGAADPKDAKGVIDAGGRGAEVAANAERVGKGLLDKIKQGVIRLLLALKKGLEKSAKAAKSAAKAATKIQEMNYALSIKDRGKIELPDLAEMVADDNQHEWNIFMAEVEVMLREFINDKDERVDGAREYYLALVTLAEYGKAIGIKVAALTRLQIRRLEIAEQRAALRLAAQRWALIQAAAQTKAEKLALARSILGDAALDLKRSLMVLAEGYSAAYAYANLEERSLRFRPSMSHALLSAEFERHSQDIGALFSSAKGAQKTYTETFELPVVTAQTTTFPTGPHAVLHVPTTGKPWLAWNVSIDDPPFKEKLNESHRSAYFIHEVRFFLDGATASSGGSVVLRVSTTGNYANGYGGTPRNTKQFYTVGYALDYIYDPAKGENAAPSTSWLPTERSKETYMSPTPFTGWTAVIERSGSIANLRALRVNFTLMRQDA